MFVPPPVKSLSKAEIEARRARLQASQNHESDSSNTSPALTKHASPASSSSENSRTVAPAIIRKIGRIGNRNEKKAAVSISSPLPSLPPSTRLPSPPSIPTSHPLPLPPDLASTHSGRRNVSPGERAQLPLGPPRRPPRPAGLINAQAGQSLAVQRSASGNSTGSKKSNGSLSSNSFHSTASVQELEGSGFDGVLEALKSIGSSATNKNSTENDDTQVRPRQNTPAKMQVVAAKKSGLLKYTVQGDRKDKKPAKQTSIVIPDGRVTDKALPDTPRSIVETPVNFYGRSILPNTPKRPGDPSKKIKPYHSLDLKRSSKLPERESNSGSTTPMQIRLRTGSLLIVTTPEMNAWRACCYIQGPIRLNKPDAMPRKNSLASLEAFQDAVDQVYGDNASLASRKKGDEAAIAEICEYFLSFGFGSIQYDGDVLAVEGGAISEESEDETDQHDTVNFETPPDSPSLYKTMLGMPEIDLPPIENEETLRAKGIARLAKLRSQAMSTTADESKQSMMDSFNAENVMPMVPMPEEGSVLTGTTSPPDKLIAREARRAQVAEPSAEVEMPFVPWVSSFRTQNLFKAASRPKRFST